MSEKYYNPKNSTMFDSNVVDGIHKRYELRVKDAQSQVSMQFESLKKLGQDLWRAQRFEDMVFGRFFIPTDLINSYVKDIRIPNVLNGLQVSTDRFNKIRLVADHVKLKNIIVDLTLREIILNRDNFKLVVSLNSLEMPKVPWYIRGMIRVGMKVTGLEISALNKALPNVKVSKSEKNPDEYIVDLTPFIKKTLNEKDLDLDMIRIRDWNVDDAAANFQISIRSEKLAWYLKKRMPILFD
jgi:hypothetical protein